MNNKQSKLIREQRLTKKSPTTVRTSQIPADRPPTPPTRREHKAALRGNTPAGQGGSKPSFGNPKVESTMSDYEYELIGESIWNTYSDMAYIMAEGKFGDWIRKKAGVVTRRGKPLASKKPDADTAAKAEGDAGRARDAERQRRFAARPRTNIKSWRPPEEKEQIDLALKLGRAARDATNR